MLLVHLSEEKGQKAAGIVPGYTSFWERNFYTVNELRSSFASTSFCVSVFEVGKLENKGYCQPSLARMHGARPCLSVFISIMARISIRRLTCWTAAWGMCVLFLRRSKLGWPLCMCADELKSTCLFVWEVCERFIYFFFNKLMVAEQQYRRLFEGRWGLGRQVAPPSHCVLSPCVSGASWGKRKSTGRWRPGRERESTWQGQHKDGPRAYCALFFLCWLGGWRQNYAVLQSSTSAHYCRYQRPSLAASEGETMDSLFNS